MLIQICVSWMFVIGWTPTRSTKVGSKAVTSIYLMLKPFASWNAHFQQKMVWILFAIIQKVTYASLSMIGLTGIMITLSSSHQIWGIVLFSCRVLVTLSSFQVSMVSLRYLVQQNPTNFQETEVTNFISFCHFSLLELPVHCTGIQRLLEALAPDGWCQHRRKHADRWNHSQRNQQQIQRPQGFQCSLNYLYSVNFIDTRIYSIIKIDILVLQILFQ